MLEIALICAYREEAKQKSRQTCISLLSIMPLRPMLRILAYDADIISLCPYGAKRPTLCHVPTKQAVVRLPDTYLLCKSQLCRAEFLPFRGGRACWRRYFGV